MSSDRRPSSMDSDPRPSSMGSESLPSSVGSDGPSPVKRQTDDRIKKNYEEFEDELEKEVQQRRESNYDVCFEHRAVLEKKFGGDIQVKLMEADNLKKIHFLEQIFEEFDADKSGHMDMHEFFVALRTCGFRVSMPAALAIMKEVDADENGTIDVDEFIEFFKKVEDLETFRYKVETAHYASGTRGKLLSGYVFVLLVGCFGLLLLDIENEGENTTVRLLLIFLLLVFFATISGVVLLPLFMLKFKPDERMADLKKQIDEVRKKRRMQKYVEETLVEPVEIPAPGPKGAEANASSAVEASRLKHPHLYITKANPFAVERPSSEASQSTASRSVGSYRKGARSEASSVTHSYRSHSAGSGDQPGSDAQGQVSISTLEKKVWEPPGAPDVEQGLTGLVHQAQWYSHSLDHGYHVSQYDKAREMQARGLQANQGDMTKSANFTPWNQSQHRRQPQ